MTTPKKSTARARPRVPGARAPARKPVAPAAAPAAQKPPAAYVIPTPVLVEVLKLVGSLPIANESAKGIYYALQRLAPAPDPDPEPAEEKE